MGRKGLGTCLTGLHRKEVSVASPSFDERGGVLVPPLFRYFLGQNIKKDWGFLAQKMG